MERRIREFSLTGDPPRTCRWCSRMMCGDGNWCEATDTLMTTAQISVRRDCPYFSRVAIDALTGARWEPSAKGGRVVEGQTRMVL